MLAGQINAVAPRFIAGQASTSVEVEVDGVRSTPSVLTTAATRPGIFMLNAAGQGAVLNEDSSVNGPLNPAARGTVIQIFATGGGETAPPLISGGMAPAPPPLHVLIASVQVQIDGIDAPVQFAGAAPQSIFGLVQINATVPLGISPAVAAGLMVTIGGIPAQAGVTVAIS
jgi:uncharacterized protein (TIGR03437 family)